MPSVPPPLDPNFLPHQRIPTTVVEFDEVLRPYQVVEAVELENVARNHEAADWQPSGVKIHVTDIYGVTLVPGVRATAYYNVHSSQWHVLQSSFSRILQVRLTTELKPYCTATAQILDVNLTALDPGALPSPCSPDPWTVGTTITVHDFFGWHLLPNEKAQVTLMGYRDVADHGGVFTGAIFSVISADHVEIYMRLDSVDTASGAHTWQEVIPDSTTGVDQWKDGERNGNNAYHFNGRTHQSAGGNQAEVVRAWRGIPVASGYGTHWLFDYTNAPWEDDGERYVYQRGDTYERESPIDPAKKGVVYGIVMAVP